MRPLIALAPAVLILGLAACASTGTSNRYGDDLRRLTDECAARGGILAPTGNQSGRPETDNVCKITGGASRLTDRE